MFPGPNVNSSGHHNECTFIQQYFLKMENLLYLVLIKKKDIGYILHGKDKLRNFIEQCCGDGKNIGVEFLYTLMEPIWRE